MPLDSLRSKMKHIERHPSESQKEAGNYKKGHVKIHGLDITIENPKGSTREGVSHDGVKWKSVLPDHYGYIRRTVGADGDHVDAYIGPDRSSTKVFVIDQKHHQPETGKHGKFDEHKCMLCYPNITSAVAAYKEAFTDDADRVMSVTIMSLPRFKKWLKDGNTKKPVNYFARGRRVVR